MAVPPENDIWIYRIVVGTLGLTALLSIVGAVVVAWLDQKNPAMLTALGSTSIGSLAGLLAPAPSGHS
jgi:hypothetical protein